MGIKFQYQKLPFGKQVPNQPLISRPFVPVHLLGKDGTKTTAPIYALLDSGADQIIFPSDVASVVGIDALKSGTVQPPISFSNETSNSDFI